MTIQQYIKLNFDGRQDKYAAAMGFHAKQVSRFCRDISCLVDHEGWPHPSFKRHKR